MAGASAGPKIVQKKVAELRPDPKNPRKNDHAVSQMARMIADFGFRVPILVRGDDIVDGHLRYKAAVRAKLDKVPALDVSDMSEDQVRAFRLAVNRSAEFAEWDEDLLAELIRDIEASGFDVESTGFDAEEIDRFLGALEEGPEEEEEGAKEGPAGTSSQTSHLTVGVQFKLTKADRTLVQDALEKVRETQHLATRADALVHLCRGVG